MENRFPLRRHLPHACGVYIMRGADKTVLYVGKAKDLAKRVSQYFNPQKPDLKNQLLAPLIRKIDYIHCASEREALIWEHRLIQRYQPFFNSMWKDDKSYPYVKISLHEDFPRFQITRKKKRDKAAYFGPYPKVTPIRQLLRTLWRSRLFPLRPCSWDFSLSKPLDRKKINSCLYYHTRECPAPCAGRISPKAYRAIAQNAVLFFKGQYGKLRLSLEREMRAASKVLEYEKAAQLRDNITALEHMGERVRYEELKSEKAAQRLEASEAVTDLQQALGLDHPPHHIECFDISHLFGRQTVGSMVCFTGGEPHSDHYRRFRIQKSRGIDDFAAMEEVVFRRARDLCESANPLPDLILIDGGKGQLSAAQKALKRLEAKTALAALAKREEELFLPGKAEPLRLERSRPALRLLQHLRDEAHRFAVTYHRLRRGKALFHTKT